MSICVIEGIFSVNVTDFFFYQSTTTSTWLGGGDMDKEGTFVWKTSNTPFTTAGYTNWTPGEPNNANNIENCVVMWQSQVKPS